MNRLSKWAAIAAIGLWGTAGLDAAPDLSSVRVYPNPVRTNMGDLAVTFDQVTANVRVDIYNVRGLKVWSREFTSLPSLCQWDLTNDVGEPVSGGVYLYILSNEAGQRHKGKVLVIR
jgi:hypothetical protein